MQITQKKAIEMMLNHGYQLFNPAGLAPYLVRLGSDVRLPISRRVFDALVDNGKIEREPVVTVYNLSRALREQHQ